MKQKPSFQFYSQDFLGSVDVQTMTAEQVGVYCLLLFNCYNNGGVLPSSEEELKLLCRGIAPAPKVMKKFYIVGEVLRHKRVDEELKKQKDYSNLQKENAKKRWEKKEKETMPWQCHGNAMASVRQSPRGVSSSTSTSSLNNTPLPPTGGGQVEKKISKYLSNFPAVDTPLAMAKDLIKKFGEKIVEKAMANPACTGSGQLYKICAQLKKGTPPMKPAWKAPA